CSRRAAGIYGLDSW
nr:immunoglobulin heavy chain junction region [Macaca mulatta]MOW91333.1 immunoglobulin heavy chain junction region [Macaca mulatta]